MLLLILLIYSITSFLFLLIFTAYMLVKFKNIESYLDELHFELALIRKKWYIICRGDTMKEILDYVFQYGIGTVCVIYMIYFQNTTMKEIWKW